ncbi:MAG: hypothetical protein R2795_15685 [Saprospiraceae bacterium]
MEVKSSLQAYAAIYDEASESLTTRYMSGRMSIPVPEVRRPVSNFIRIKGARHHNLKNVDVDIPSTPSPWYAACRVVANQLGQRHTLPRFAQRHRGHLLPVTGLAPRYRRGYRYADRRRNGQPATHWQIIPPNPITYVKAYDTIRQLMADQQLSKIRGFKPGHFSFNVEGGRCEACSGEGEQVIEMQFLADVRLECEDCRGKRFKKKCWMYSTKEKASSIFWI